MTAPAPFADRLARLRAAMAEALVDAFLCDHAEMLAWISGFTISETFYRGVVVPRAGDPIWILREIDRLPCERATWVPVIQTYGDGADAHAVVAKAITDLGATRLGADFQSFGFTAHTWQRLRALLPEVEIIDMPRVSDHLRAQKDESEIALIRAAAEIADRTMAFVADTVAEGQPVRDVIAQAAEFAIAAGGDDHWVGPVSISRSVASGGHGMGFLHARHDELRLSAGDVLHVELVPKVRNYSARMMRSIRLGEPSAEERDIVATLAKIQDAQIAAMRPDARASDIDAIARQPLLDSGLRDSYPNITGYQLGLYAKTPRSSDTSLSFHPSADWQLEANQVFHMYVTAAGLALSETVIVTAAGGARLTQTPRVIIRAGDAPRVGVTAQQWGH